MSAGRDDVASVVRSMLAEVSVDEWWKRLEHLGMLDLLAPEDLGGGGASHDLAVAVVQEAAARAVTLPVGEAVLLAVPLLAAAGLPHPGGVVTATAGEGLELERGHASGDVRDVPCLRAADHVVVLLPERSSAILLDVRSAGLTSVDHTNLAGEARDLLTLRDVPVVEHPLAGRDWAAWYAERGAFLRAVQIVGAASRVRDLAIAHVTVREQFGRPLAAFQAVQHRLVELASEVALMAAAVDAATSKVDEDPDSDTDSASFLVAVAKAQCSASAGKVAAAGHQLHGAIGFTAEHELGTLTKRLWAWRDEFGDEWSWWGRVGRQVVDCPEGLWPLLTAAVDA